MSIDIEQLPIPDWGLHCPTCRYPLVGLNQHRCPECGNEFRMVDIVPTWQRLREPRLDGGELPFPDYGLQCKTCENPLAGMESFRCPHCDTLYDPDAVRPEAPWFVVDEHFARGLPLAGVESLLATQQVPFAYQRDKLLKDIYFGQNILGSRLLVPTEFYFEVRWLLQMARTESERDKSGDQDWKCPACGEDVPGHFDLCWNCEAPRKQAL